MQILYLDDNERITELFETYVGRKHDRISVATATSAEEATREFETAEFDCFITDFVTTADGEPFVREVRRSRPDLPVLLYSGKPQAALDELGGRFGLDGAFRKGSAVEDFETLVTIGETLASLHRSRTGSGNRPEGAGTWNWSVHSGGIEADRFEHRLFEALEEHTGRTFDEFPPLFETIDPEALTDVLRADPDATRIVVRFPYDRYEIAVANAGAVGVRSIAEEAKPAQ